MANTILNGPPSPEDFQRQISDFMRQHFQMGGAKPQTETEGASEGPENKARGAEFQFDYKPREVKAYLDRFVIKQEEAKKVLSVAICDHYHQVRLAREHQANPNYIKQNIILLGPTGVGKTYLIRSLADLIGVPFVKGDATKFSETGYVGGDVEDLVRELVRRSDGDVERAQYGIIYIDEVDKIATASTSNGRDVSGRGVQTNLLKLMEETEVPVRSPQDIAGQVQAMMEMQRGKKSPAVINTKHILFIVSGAFDRLEKIVQRRLREATIGFAAKNQAAEADQSLELVQTPDFIEFGFEPEFIGRLPVRVVCQSLNADDLFQILKTSEGSIIRQYEQAFAAYGIEAQFNDDGLREIAAISSREQTGARGLMTVCERVFRNFKYELPSTQVRQFTVTDELVRRPEGELTNLLAQHQQHEAQSAHENVHDFARQFSDNHGLKINFTSEAAELVVSLAAQQSQSVREFCQAKFKDFQFGLKLVARNTGQNEFQIDPKTVEAPDKALSDWVVASYRRGE
jgi:ATP-dependent Clp protease ATP-binding subunit ClpX